MEGGKDRTPRLAELADFRLGSAFVRPALRRIEGPSAVIALEPRVMQVLVVLHEAGGHVVTREELVRRCWGGLFISDDSLNRAISAARRAFREAGVSDITLETIPRTGYRLVADQYSEGSPDRDVATDHTAEAAGQGRPLLSRRKWLAGGLLAAGVASAAPWLVMSRSARRRDDAGALVERSEWALRNGMPATNAEAARLLEQAAGLEPEDARIWGKLALARAIAAETTPPDRMTQVVAGVQNAAGKAMALNPRQVDAHAALAILPPYFGDWFAAERRLQTVLKIDPDHLPTRDVYDFFKVAVGRAREGSGDRLVIAAREPMHAVHQFKKVYSHWILGQIGEADRTADRALQLWPKNPAVWFSRLWTLVFTDRASRALAHALEADPRPDFPPWMVQTLIASMTALESWRPADIASAVDHNLADLRRGPVQAVNAMLCLTALGEIDHAFDVAHAYFLERGPLIATPRWRPGQLSIHDLRRRASHILFIPATRPLRADPRFPSLCREVGLADYWRSSGTQPDFLTGP